MRWHEWNNRGLCFRIMHPNRVLVLHYYLRRLAYLPLTATWFPPAGEPGAGVLGRAPKALRDRANAVTTELARRRPETLNRSGPLWGPA